MQPIDLQNLDQDLPMGVFNHDSNLLSMDAEEDLDLLALGELGDNELDMLETLVDGDTADFMQALELLELREEVKGTEEQASLNALSSDVNKKGKFANSITDSVEQTELKDAKKSKKKARKHKKKNKDTGALKQIADVAKDLEEKLEKEVPIVKEAEEELKPKPAKKLNDLLEEDETQELTKEVKDIKPDADEELENWFFGPFTRILDDKEATRDQGPQPDVHPEPEKPIEPVGP